MEWQTRMDEYEWNGEVECEWSVSGMWVGSLEEWGCIVDRDLWMLVEFGQRLHFRLTRF